MSGTDFAAWKSPGFGVPAIEERAWKNSKSPFPISSGFGPFTGSPSVEGAAPMGACQTWDVRFIASSQAPSWPLTQSSNTTCCALSDVFSLSLII